ncbi:hypothetical protein DICA0_F18954 [Diutina catenulata]
MSDNDELLLDSQFYSAPTANGPNNHHHVHNLRQSVAPKNSVVTKSIHDKLNYETTSAMKVSPSMKQLESILHEKTAAKSSEALIAPVEEEEEEEVRMPSPPMAHPLLNDSIQTFETAETSHSRRRPQRKRPTDEEPSSPDKRTDSSRRSLASSRPQRTKSIPKAGRSLRPVRIKAPTDSPVLQYDPDRSYNIPKSHFEPHVTTPLKAAPAMAVTPSPTPSPPTTSSKKFMKVSNETYPNHADDHSHQRSIGSSSPRRKNEQFTEKRISSQESSASRDKRHTRTSSGFSLTRHFTNQTLDSTKDDVTRRPRSSTLNRLRLGTQDRLKESPKSGSSKTSNPTTPVATKGPEKKRGFFRSLFKSRSKQTLVESSSTPDVNALTKSAEKRRDKSSQSAHSSPQKQLVQQPIEKPRKNSEMSGNSRPISRDLKRSLDASRVSKEEGTKVSKPPSSTSMCPSGSPNLTSESKVPKQRLDATIEAAESLSIPSNRTSAFRDSSRQNEASRGRLRTPKDLPRTASPAGTPSLAYSLESTPESELAPVNPGRVTDDEESLLDASMSSFDYKDPPNQLSLQGPESLSPGFGSPFVINYSPRSGFGASPSPANIDRKFRSSVTNVPTSAKSLLEVTSPQAPFRMASVSSKASSDSKREQLLGEALFPKSLNPQEVESIVSLERSRSMRSIRSNKRSSFVGYQGGEDNISYQGVPSPSSINTNPPKRSSSILKHSTSRRSVDQVLSPASSSNQIAPTSVIGDGSGAADSSIAPSISIADLTAPDVDLTEFSDFLDFDNISFTHSPKLVPSPQQVPCGCTSPVTADRTTISPVNEVDEPVIASPLSSPHGTERVFNTHNHVASESNTPQQTVEIPQSSHKALHEVNPINSSPSNPNSKNPSDFDQPLSPSPSPPVQTSSSPSLVSPGRNCDDAPSPSSENVAGYSPILHTAVKMSPVVDGRINNRPVSMSFRGLNHPQFGRSFAHHNLRNSDSHQSFNISFEDSDYSVGGGFGSDSEDSDVSSSIKSPPRRTGGAGIQAPTRGHATTPSVDSPRSFSSLISRKLNKKLSSASVASTPSSHYTHKPMTPAPIVSNAVRFSSRIILYDTYNGDEYDRHPETATCNQLTPQLAQQIKEELNSFKSSMEIHVDSQCYTHFF